ncbi:MAG: Crp/Fnr family transcriptional regulator [Neomegalonema sp.]|nr:Crp/Fnr family transcriptional regulator [Neomegalonema sp.]
MSRTAHSLKSVCVLGELAPEARTRLEGRISWSEVDPNALILDYEEESTDVRCVISGEVRALHRAATGKEVILGDLGAGSLFGEMAAIDGVARSAAVIALTRSVVGKIPAGAFIDAVTQDPLAARALMVLMAGRIRELNRRLAEHVYLTARQRLCAELLRLSRPRLGAPEIRVITPPPLQQVIADRIGARREVVTRELSALGKAGLVEKQRGALVLLNPTGINGIIGEVA